VGIISNNGGKLVSDQGGGLVGEARPWRLLGVGARHLLQAAAVDQLPVAGVVVEVRDAAGAPVRDAAGQPLVATTDAAGQFRFAAALPDTNLVLSATLPAARGAIQAIATRDARQVALEADLFSTLTTTYILDRFVASQADLQATLDRRPGDVSRTTRERAAAAFSEAGQALPAQLDAATALATTEALRGSSGAFDHQLEVVRRLLIAAGQSNLGEGRPATEVRLENPHDLSLQADGAVYFVSDRLWRVGPEGTITRAAGGGTVGRPSAAGQPITAIDLPIPYGDEFMIDALGRIILRAGLELLMAKPEGTVISWRLLDGQHLLAGADAEGVLLVDRSTVGALRVLRLAADGTTRELRRVTLPTGVRCLDAGVDPRRGLLVLLGKDWSPESVAWVNLATGVLTPWPTPGTGRALGSWVDVARDGHLFTQAFDGPLRHWAPGVTSPVTYTQVVEELTSVVRGAEPGELIVATAKGQVHRVTPTRSTPVAGVDPAAPVGGGATDLALAQPMSLGVDSGGALWIVDEEMRKLLRVDSAGKVSEVPLPGPGFAASLEYRGETSRPWGPGMFDADLVWHRPLLHGGPGGKMYMRGTTAAGSGLLEVRADGFSTLLYAPPADVLITDFAPLADGAILILLDPLDAADSLVRRAPDGTITTLFTAAGTRRTRVVNQLTGATQTYTVSDPNLTACDMQVDPATGAVWLHGQGRLGRWRPTEGWEVVAQQADMWSYPRFVGHGLALAPDGTLYRVPRERDRIQADVLRRFDPQARTESTVVGAGGLVLNGAGVDTSLRYPACPVFAPNGDLLLIDGEARQVKRVPRTSLPGTP
jgi:hypothetical protein